MTMKMIDTTVNSVKATLSLGTIIIREKELGSSVQPIMTEVQYLLPT